MFPSTEDQIKAEIMKLRPLEEVFNVYDDFFKYKSGTRLVEGSYNLNFASDDLIVCFKLRYEITVRKPIIGTEE